MMSSNKSKLRLMGAFAALATLALAVSCRGFFVNPTVTALTINPTTPTVPLGGTTQLSAFATFSDGSTGDVTNKVSWSSNSGTVDVNSGGLLTGKSLSNTTATITAADQTITQTATASVCVEGGSDFAISPVNASVPAGTPQPYTASATAVINQVSTPGIDITPGVQWSTNNTSVTISSGTDPVTATTTTASTTPVVITASYTCNGVTNTFTTNLTVN
ncbi:MAG TPA: Ig-like domain-containing protein [Candidatus Binatus sp.]|jgi:trimeric autotransporter adhesin|nr:Ig-like domain-containing protein [Candidatus Binatus sp.]